MKKSLFLFVVLFSLSAYAENRNFYLNTKELNIQTTQILPCFYSWFNLDKSISFDIVKEREDQFGAKHLTFQEYVNNIPVDKCVLLVHAKDGYVTSVNGLVMEIAQKPSSCNQRFSRKSAAKQIPAKVNEDQQLVIVSIQKSDSCIYRYAYKYFSNETFTYYYVDIETGEIIREESTIANTSKSGTAYTYYQGWKNINYSNTTDGKNILVDETRNIYTMDASALSTSDIENTIYYYDNPSSEWYEPVLTSVKITYAAQSWWYSVTDANPDFYIKVKNTSGTVLYTSGYYSDVNVPVTFNIPGEIVAAGNLVIEIYDYDGVSDDYGGSVSVTATEAGTYTWSGTNTKGEIVIGKHTHPALDVHWGMEKVYDYYLSKFKYKSFDGNGAAIIQLVAPPSSVFSGFPNNACAVNGTFMAYGMGDGVTMNPVVAIDVMGHEFTHMVTAVNGSQSLPNYGIGGALNESYADIIGMCIKNYAVGSVDWLIGNGVMIGSTYGMRSMKNPKVAGHPNCYEGTNYNVPTGNPNNETNDMDYVHSNNGVQNFWFYLLCNGGAGTNDKGNSYNVVGIGIDKAVQIAFSSLVDYIQSNDGWFESREHTLEAAAEIYGRTSQEYQSVANAWYAVGVGNKYLEPLKPGKYVVWVDADTCSWFMSSILTTTSTKRLVADTIYAYKDYYYVNPDPNYLWEITKNTNGTYYFKGNGNYLTWNSGNSASLSATPKELSVTQADDYTYMVSFPAIAEESRYLSLNTSNPYFAFYNNKGQHYKFNFLEAVFADTLIIRAKKPSNWGSTIRAWVWYDGETGYWETPTTEGDWYVFKGMIYDEYTKFNIIFVNGTNWSTDNNQTVDISVSQDMCIQIGSNSGKRTYTNIDCEDKPAANSYYLLVRRKTGDYYYLTPTTVSGKERLVAIDAGDSVRSKIDTVNAPTSYLWTLENANDGVKLKGSSNTYLYTSAAKSAKMDSTGFILKQRSNSEGTYTFYYPKSSTENWYLSLATAGNDYYVFYANENQFTHFLLMKPGNSMPTPTPAIVDNNKEQPKAKKILRNGQLYILRDGKTYNAQGGEL